ncbi:MAG: class I adenylate-forming enzyme family protein [Fimbriiglobus sp.]
MALWRVLRDAAGRHPDRVAVSATGVDYSYADLDDRVERAAAGFHFQGLAAADRVVSVLGNTIPHLVTMLGALRAGLVTVPMAPGSIPAQVRYALRTCGARGVVAPPATLAAVFDGHDELRPDVTVAVGDPDPPRGILPWEVIEAGPGDPPPTPDPGRDHLGLIVFTSGTTSRPKAVVHMQNRMARRAAGFADAIGLTAADVTFVAHPVGRPLTLLGQILTTFQVGGRVILHDGMGKGFWPAYAAGPPKTFVVTLPGFLTGLLTDPAAATADHSRLRLWLAGGDAVSADLQAKFRSTTGRPLVEMCGMTEVGFYAINPPAGPVRVGSVGQPMRGVVVRLLGPDGADVPAGEVGEIVLRTPDLMAGYWNDTAETFRVLRDGWLHTGDLARADDVGFLWFAGRASDTINRGGRKIAPPMVEAALAGHPAVGRAVVVGVPDTVCGQAPFAFLELRHGTAAPPFDSLRAWLADKLDEYAIPVGFAVVAEWPLTDQGKIDRPRLGWMAANGGAAV